MATFDLTTPEVWYPVPDRLGYEVSSHFRVRSWRVKGSKTRIAAEPSSVSVYPNADGYLCFYTRSKGKSRTVYLHHVVAELAHGPRPQGLNVLHDDDVKTNNDPGNLSYGTQQKNIVDSFRNGRSARGGLRTQAKINEAGAIEIRRRYATGERQRAIAADLRISQSLVSLIVKGERWAHVP